MLEDVGVVKGVNKAELARVLEFLDQRSGTEALNPGKHPGIGKSRVAEIAADPKSAFEAGGVGPGGRLSDEPNELNPPKPGKRGKFDVPPDK